MMPDNLRPIFVENVFGHIMYQNVHDLGVNIGSLNGQNFDDISRFGEFGLIRDLRAGDTVLDVGANVGLFTLLFARAVGASGRVFAFEPGVHSYMLLQKNIRTNGYTNVTAANLAVGNVNKVIDLWVCLTGETDNRTEPVATDEFRFPVLTRCVRPDDYLPNGLIADYIKMDIQGAEYGALLGMSELIDRSPSVRLLVEWVPTDPNAANVLGFLRAKNFIISDCPNDGPMHEQSDDDLFSKYLSLKRHTNILASRPQT